MENHTNLYVYISRPQNKVRRASDAADVTVQRPSSPPCRRPFPLVIHELRLKDVMSYKVVV